MQIEDNFVLDAPIDVAWRCIRSPEFVASCLPGCEGVTQVSDLVYRAAVAVAMRPFHMRFNLEVEITSETPNREVGFRARGEEGGRASTVSAENILTLSAIADDRTQIFYSSMVHVGGRLGRFGLGVMKKRVVSLANEFAEQLSRRIKEEITP